MILAENIVAFSTDGDSLVAATKEVVFDVASGEVLLRFKAPITTGSLLAHRGAVSAYDHNGECRVHFRGRIWEMRTGMVRQVVEGDIYFVVGKHVHLRSALVDIYDAKLWTVGYRSMISYVVEKKVVILSDRADSHNQRLVGVDYRTGKELYSIEFGSVTPDVIGVEEGVLWVVNERAGSIVSYDAYDGRRLAAISEQCISEMQKVSVRISVLKYDASNQKLVHPYGELDITNESFRLRKQFPYQQPGSKLPIFPQVLLFDFNDKHIVHGLWVHLPDGDAEGRLQVVSRDEESKLLLDIYISDTRTDAGLVDVALLDDSVIYLDNDGYLREVKFANGE